MKRVLSLIFGALFAVLMFGSASAQVAGVSVVVPAGPSGTLEATVGGVVCGSVTTSTTAISTLTLDTTNPVCVTPGAVISFTSNGVGLDATLIVPTTGSGSLVLADLSPADAITITVPAVPNGSGSISAFVDGQICATVDISATTTTTISLPAACAVPGEVISFQGAGGAVLTSTLTVPATGGATLVLSALTATNPVTVTVPSGTDTLEIFVDGEACGSVDLDAVGTTTITLPVTCAAAGETVTFITEAGVQLAALQTVPTAGGTLTVAALTPATVRVILPAGPAGEIIAMVDGEVCGEISTSASGTRTLVLIGDCSIPGAVIEFETSNGIKLDATLTISDIIDDETLVLANLDAEDPLNIRLPAGDGEVDIFVDGLLCATVDLSSTGTTTVELAATCIDPGADISFEVDGDEVDEMASIPGSGSGTVVITSLDLFPQVPAPANTGSFGTTAESGGMTGLALALATLAGVLTVGAVVRRQA